MAAQLRVVIAHDSALFRDVIAEMCRAAGMRVVGDADTIEALASACRITAPDVAVSAVELGGEPIAIHLDRIRSHGVRVVAVGPTVSRRRNPLIALGAAGWINEHGSIAEAVGELASFSG